MINFNDLVGLRYGWGHGPRDGSGFTDCFQLVCEVHRRMGMADYSAKYEWVYQQYTEASFPRGLIVRWLLQNGQRQTRPTAGCVALLPVRSGAALGTYTDATNVLFIGASSSVIHVPLPTIGHILKVNQ